MMADWRQNPIAPGRRKRPWRGVTIFDWVAAVPNVGVSGAMVYGCLVEGAGSATECKDVSKAMIARRLEHSEKWVGTQLDKLVAAKLIEQRPPKAKEKCLRWRFRNHPAEPNYYRGEANLWVEAMKASEQCVELWRVADVAADDLHYLGEWFYYSVRNGGTGPTLLVAQVKRFLAVVQPEHLDRFNCALPVFRRWVLDHDWDRVEPAAYSEFLGWEAFVQDERKTERFADALAREDDTFPAKVEQDYDWACNAWAIHLYEQQKMDRS